MKRFAFAVMLLAVIACASLDATPVHATNERTAVLRQIVQTSSMPVSRIAECKLEGKRIYDVSYNANDAMGGLFDAQGMQLPIHCGCGIACFEQSPECSRIVECEAVYKAKGNIYDRETLDKYGIGQ